MRPNKIVHRLVIIQYSCKVVLYHHAKFGGVRISPAAGVAKNVELLFVCLSIRQAFER